MRHRALFASPLIALILVACGDKSSVTSITAATDPAAETVAETVAATTNVAIDPVAETAAAATEIVATEGTDTVPAGAPGGDTFSIVAAISGTWPSPMPTGTKVSAIDTEMLCANLLKGGAFGDLEGDYFGGMLSSAGDDLQFRCRYRYTTQAPVPLDGFADGFLDGLKGTEEPSRADQPDSVGLVEFTLAGDPLGAEPDQFVAADRGCLAAAAAVGLTGPWSVETLGSVDGNRVVTCRGPIPNADVRTADPSLIAKAVGADGPPLE